MRSLLALVLCLLALAAPAARAAPLSGNDELVFERTARNALYVELLGSGVVYSLNYERFLSDDVSFRLGVGYLGASESDGSAEASASLSFFPVTVSYLGLRSNSHVFELGGGATIVHVSTSVSDDSDSYGFSGSGVAGTAIVGYRYAPMQGGLNFRAALTPLFGQGGFMPWVGLAVGYAF